MTYIPRCFCTTCGYEMKINKTGLTLQVCANAIPGPYYKIRCDEYACPKCRTTVAYCHPHTEPFAEHFQEGFSSRPFDKEALR